MAETKEVTIHDVTIALKAPYQEGHVLSAIEAKVLNQTRCENVGNNFRKRIKAALDGVPVKEGGEVETLDAVLAALAEYDATYEFSTPSPGREPVDPVEREARNLAKDAIRKALAARGQKLKDIDEEKLEAAIEKHAASESIRKEAERRVKAAKKQAESVMEELGI